MICATLAFLGVPDPIAFALVLDAGSEHEAETEHADHRVPDPIEQ